VRETLQEYYEQELRFLRKMGQEFAESYPKIASRLVLGEEDHPDPHVERLLEGVAFLSARVRLKIDEDFPEITDALLNVIYPHYIRPLPPMSVAEFELDPQQGKLTSGLHVPRNSTLYSRQTGESRCEFRTCYETTIWPIEIVSADWRPPEKLDPPVRGMGAKAVVRLELRCAPELTFDKLNLRNLRFYLNGDSGLVLSLYEVLLNNCSQILVRDPQNPKRTPLRLSASSLKAVGFDDADAMLPYPNRSFDGYRLLQEYFAFPQKFHFLDLLDLDQVCAAGFKESIEILFFISPFERDERAVTLQEETSSRTFRLGCTPIVNLFSEKSEPIVLSYRTQEYDVIPDTRRQRNIEIFSIDNVVSAKVNSKDVVRYEPFFSFRHSRERADEQTFWYGRRRPAQGRKKGYNDYYLSLVDLSGRSIFRTGEVITAQMTCTNRDLPSGLFGNEAGAFELKGGGPLKRIVAREKPTPFRPCPSGRSAFWRLISHLSLNHLSLEGPGPEALQEILQLYTNHPYEAAKEDGRRNIGESVHINRQIQGIRSVSSKPHFARVRSDYGVGFARGRLVELEIDEDSFTGSGVFLFASILDRFLAMYVSLNSFSQLELKTLQRKEVLGRWLPRSGKKILM
jgi:type VI secretion system protein ImpG